MDGPNTLLTIIYTFDAIAVHVHYDVVTSYALAGFLVSMLFGAPPPP